MNFTVGDQRRIYDLLSLVQIYGYIVFGSLIVVAFRLEGNWARLRREVKTCIQMLLIFFAWLSISVFIRECVRDTGGITPFPLQAALKCANICATACLIASVVKIVLIQVNAKWPSTRKKEMASFFPNGQ